MWRIKKMNVSKISFGNIVKVNASKLNSMDIVTIANGFTYGYSPKLIKQVKALFPDKGNDRVEIEMMDNKPTYLFSGKEQKEWQKLHHDKMRKLNRVRSTKEQSYNTDFLANQVELEYKKKIEEFVKKNAGAMKEIEVKLKSDNKTLDSINLLS